MDFLVQVIVHLQLVQVDHRTAAVAYEVAVGSDGGVEAFLAIDHANTFYDTLFLEEDQIPIYGTET